MLPSNRHVCGELAGTRTSVLVILPDVGFVTNFHRLPTNEKIFLKNISNDLSLIEYLGQKSMAHIFCCERIKKQQIQRL